MALLVMPAVAPDVARDYGVDPALIGYQISLATVGLLTSLLFLGNLSQKFGPARTNQIGHLVLAMSMLILLVPSPAVAIAGSVAIGLGFGLLMPSAATLLMKFTPPDRRNVVFSIQQTGVPLGGVLAAVIAPPIAVAAGWRWSLVVTATLLVCMAAVVQRGRAVWDADRVPHARLFAHSPIGTLALVWGNRRLRLMAIAGACFSWAQFTVASYTVVACVTALGFTLILAGTMLLIVQLSNALGRVLAGWLADRIEGGGRRVMTWIAGMMIVASCITAGIGTGWPLPLLYASFAFLGMASGAWAGLGLAEIGRLAPPGQISNAVSGAMALMNVGKFTGPIVFANVYFATESYNVAFVTLSAPAILALYCINRARRG